MWDKLINEPQTLWEIPQLGSNEAQKPARFFKVINLINE